MAKKSDESIDNEPKKEKFLELQSIMRAASKRFGKDMTGTSFEAADPLSTGSFALDIALRVCGLPRGRVHEFFGWEGSGKTSMALLFVAQAQKRRRELGIQKKDLILDVEHSMYDEFLQGFGIDLDEVIWLRPDTAEEALGVCVDYVKSGQIDVVVLDSVDALQNERQLSRDIGATDVGGISKIMSESMRQISKLAPTYDTTYIFINQLRMNPSQMMGDPKTTPGGNALKFYSTCRLEFMKGKGSANLPGALGMRVKVIKNKCGAPWGKEPVAIDFYYGKGPDVYMDLYNVAKELKIIRSAGPTVKEGDTTVCGGGKLGFIEHLKTNPDEFTRYKNLCIQQAGGNSDSIEANENDDESDDND